MYSCTSSWKDLACSVFSETYDNVVMWSHYADEHRGVVFRVGCLPEVDNLLLVARKIRYTQSFDMFPGAEDYARHLTSEKPIEMSEVCWEVAFTKHSDWAYEKEWRVHMPQLDQPKGDGFTLIPEDRRVFQELYLGCRMDPRTAGELRKVAEEQLPDMKVFQSRMRTDGFGLQFVEI